MAGMLIDLNEGRVQSRTRRKRVPWARNHGKDAYSTTRKTRGRVDFVFENSLCSCSPRNRNDDGTLTNPILAIILRVIIIISTGALFHPRNTTEQRAAGEATWRWHATWRVARSGAPSRPRPWLPAGRRTGRHKDTVRYSGRRAARWHVLLHVASARVMPPTQALPGRPCGPAEESGSTQRTPCLRGYYFYTGIRRWKSLSGTYAC